MESHWSVVFKQFRKNKTGVAALCVLVIFVLAGIYAPLFASSKPFLVLWDGQFYFPLLRYLFYAGFYTKPIDLFFNLLMFTLPLALLAFLIFRRARKVALLSIFALHCALFVWMASGVVKNPESDAVLTAAKKKASEEVPKYHEDPLLAPFPAKSSWASDLKYLSPYARLNQILDYKSMQTQHAHLQSARATFEKSTGREMPTLWHVFQRNESSKAQELQGQLKALEANYLKARDQFPKLADEYRPFSHTFIMAKYVLQRADSLEDLNRAENHLLEVVNQAGSKRTALANARHLIVNYQKIQGQLAYLAEKKSWFEKESQRALIVIPSFVRPFHWEEDAGGAQEANQYVPWYELTRINRKDLVSGLLFGIRISIVVGVLSIAIALAIGVPLGTIAGYFAGKTDLVACRFIEMWEAMPTFFMLLLVVAITQSKSIFLVIAVLGIFGWTGFARFTRSEVLRQRKLPYVDACRSLGFTHRKIMFSHILPNAIPPVLTLLPFSMMAAITSEAGLSFLGLGAEGSASWGVLMDEGRSVFPAESYLLWPPAILLTTLLVSIALIGDALRDALDPKMRQ